MSCQDRACAGDSTVPAFYTAYAHNTLQFGLSAAVCGKTAANTVYSFVANESHALQVIQVCGSGHRVLARRLRRAARLEVERREDLGVGHRVVGREQGVDLVRGVCVPGGQRKHVRRPRLQCRARPGGADGGVAQRVARDAGRV